MRLTLALGYKSVDDMEDSLGADEWDRWLAFHALYDLPDAFMIVGQLGALISAVAGGKGRPADFAPYYQSPPRRGPGPPPGIADAIAFLKAHGQQRPHPGPPQAD
ncbi:MAG: hypothetical protein U0790_25280 [Isosphaeraceae bacterium]